ncbi:hypothetical protein GGR56DRAFT_617391 [Xylariaceae sp. FL0804]|nr:hypothetical protein GGR56DRAFT_617391 [Xylariaceae sp. FL0804]
MSSRVPVEEGDSRTSGAMRPDPVALFLFEGAVGNGIPEADRQEARRQATENRRAQRERHLAQADQDDRLRFLVTIPHGRRRPTEEQNDQHRTDAEQPMPANVDGDRRGPEPPRAAPQAIRRFVREESLHLPGPGPCIACEEETPQDFSTSLACGHAWCRDCLGTFAKYMLDDKPFQPAKCCQIIPVQVFERVKVFTAEDAQKYRDRMDELTNIHHKLYCWNKDCASYIPSANMKRRIGVCQKCEKKTCRTCREKSHWGPCDQEKLREAKASEDIVFKLAEAKGWKRCPNCLNLVQKNGGCNAMTCNCGQSFCYACGGVFSYLVGDEHHCQNRRARH